VTNPNHYWIPHQAFSSLLNKKKQTIERDEKNTSMTTHSFLIFTKGVATKTGLSHAHFPTPLIIDVMCEY